MSNFSLSCCFTAISLISFDGNVVVSNSGPGLSKVQTMGTEKYHAVMSDSAGSVSIVDIASVAELGSAPFVPKTKHGKILWEAIQEIVESGEPLIDARELLTQLAASRGR